MDKFTIVFQECEEGGFSAYIKEIPGAISEGETVIETAENVFDALVQVLAAQAEEELSKKKTASFPLELELAL
jgi:predicted RNase H-like HicB family nuclease